MVLLGWSQRELFSERLYDHIQFNPETKLTHVTDAYGDRYVGIEVSVNKKGIVNGEMINEAFNKLEPLRFGTLLKKEPRLYCVEV